MNANRNVSRRIETIDICVLTMNRQNTRLHELDSLRALAAIGVIAYHYRWHFEAAPLPFLMAPFYKHGLLLVDFFFVLSGFVIARAYWTENRRTLFFPNVRQRIARMYPLHFVTLCGVAVMQWILVHDLSSPPFVYRLNNSFNFVANLFLVNRTGIESGFSFNGPAWSISTEFVINLLFLGLITLPRKITTFAIAAIFGVSLVIVMQHGLITNDKHFGIDNDIFRTVVGFSVGIATNAIEPHIRRVLTQKLAYDCIAMLSIVAVLCYCAIGTTTRFSDLVIALACFPALIISATNSFLIKRILLIAPLVSLGTISYSLYLVHFPLQLAIHLFALATHMSMPYENPLFLVGFLIATIGLASITYFTIELPGKVMLNPKKLKIEEASRA